jgi:hypothetical protein
MHFRATDTPLVTCAKCGERLFVPSVRILRRAQSASPLEMRALRLVL